MQALRNVDVVFRGLWVPTTKGLKFPPPPPPAPRSLVVDTSGTGAPLTTQVAVATDTLG